MINPHEEMLDEAKFLYEALGKALGVRGVCLHTYRHPEIDEIRERARSALITARKDLWRIAEATKVDPAETWLLERGWEAHDYPEPRGHRNYQETVYSHPKEEGVWDLEGATEREKARQPACDDPFHIEYHEAPCTSEE